MNLGTKLKRCDRQTISLQFIQKEMLNIFQFCWSLGGALAQFKDKAEESHVASFLNTDGEFWIGLNDLSEEGF